MSTNDYSQNIKDTDELEKMRHSFAHVLAQAVMRIYPEAKLGIGPAIENGFYYEFELPQISDNDLPKIEKEMQKIIEEEMPITQALIPREAAFDMLHQQGQIYKTELLQEVADEEISFFKTGEEFIDLCRGPHISNTGKLGAFKLINIEQVHWKRDENRPLLFKINGIAFKNEQELKNFLEWEEEKQEKEHRVIGPKRDFFSSLETTGAGLPMWLEEGTKVKNIIMDFIRKEREKRDFIEVETPNIAKASLFKETGHFEFYQDLDINPFKIDNDLYMLRPMATPSHIEVYRTKRKGYKNLPFKVFEFAKTYRDEDKKLLNGMVRTREFTQDAAHIFCTHEDAIEEVQNLLNLTITMLKAFGFREYRLQFARRDKKKSQDYIGTSEIWETSENILIKALEKSRLVAREAIGEADFFGPKIDFLVKDIFGKEWQVSTIQTDLIIPNRCKLNYTDKEGKEKTPLLIHYSAVGSLERFIALLIEHYSGALPLWLSPTQAMVLPISETFERYAKEVNQKLLDIGIRAKMDLRQETLQNKIRQAQLKEIPFMIVIGKQEMASEVISIRPRNGEDWGVMKIEEFKDKFQAELEKY